eukprot:1185244-Prorocentrum_minimum.AAC.4
MLPVGGKLHQAQYIEHGSYPTFSKAREKERQRAVRADCSGAVARREHCVVRRIQQIQQSTLKHVVTPS